MIEREEVVSVDVGEFIVEECAVDLRYALSREKITHRMAAEENDELRLDEVELFVEPRATRFFLGWFRIAIIRRAVFDDIRDVDVLALKADIAEHLVEEFTCSTDEWHALFILRLARCFTDKDNLGISAAIPGDRLGRSRLECAVARCKPLLMYGAELFLFCHPSII